MDFNQKLEEFKDYLSKIEYLGSAMGVLYWDLRVGIPKKGVPYRAEVLGYLSSELYKLQTSDKIKEFIDYFEGCSELDDITSAMIKRVKKEYEETKKIPEDRNREFVILTSEAEDKWQEAKEKSDFSIFKPYLKRLVDMTKEFIGYWGYGKNKYDTLLDHYEMGATTEKLDRVFGELRDAIVSLLERIKEAKNPPRGEILRGDYSKESQDRLSRKILERMGYDFEAGRLDESAHPFTIEFANKDVRITTKYLKDDFTSALFSSIHEGGHAIYEQNVSDDLKGTTLGTGVSMGVHESQSRFYENIIGRSRGFWNYFYGEVINEYKDLGKIPVEEFYRAVNTVSPSLIRVEADELTYSLHIIIRYEIEKLLINDEISVDDLPRVWNEKYKEYLGVEPQNDGEGVLQDIHWAGGSFGYFPSYALGNLYGAQFLNTMEKDITDLWDRIEKGDFTAVKGWLGEKVHRHGAVYEPSKLLMMVTGEGLNPKYFIEYLNKKYTEIYNL